MLRQSFEVFGTTLLFVWPGSKSPFFLREHMPFTAELRNASKYINYCMFAKEQHHVVGHTFLLLACINRARSNSQDIR